MLTGAFSTGGAGEVVFVAAADARQVDFSPSAGADLGFSARAGTAIGSLHFGQRIFLPAAASGRRNLPAQWEQLASTVAARVVEVTGGSGVAGSGSGTAISGGTSIGALHLGQRIFLPAAASGRRNFPSQLGQAASTGMEGRAHVAEADEAGCEVPIVRSGRAIFQPASGKMPKKRYDDG